MKAQDLFNRIPFNRLLYSQVINCEFKDKSRAHNWEDYWEDYVDEFYQDNWDKLSDETKVVIYDFALNIASREEWE